MYKVLWYGDSPLCATGFAQVTRNVLKQLHKTGLFDIDILAINFDGSPYNHEEFPYKIHPATSGIRSDYTDLMGRKKLLDMLDRRNYDIVIFLQDTFNMLPIMDKLLKIQEKKKFVMVYYFVIDVINPKREWITKVISKMDYPVSCTQYAKDVCMKFDPDLKRMSVIEYGVDLNVFHPVETGILTKFKNEAFVSMDAKAKDGFFTNKYVVLNVNRNQIRKDYLSTMLAFKEFQKQVPEAFLFCLASIKDQGGDLFDLAEFVGLTYGKDWVAPINYTPGDGFPIEDVNLIYNVADMVISTSSGEGYGLSSIEAMAVKKPVVFPANTSFFEIIGDTRGYLVPTKDYLFFGHQDNNRVRPKINIDKMAETMLYCYQHPEETQQKVETAYKWVLTQTWEMKLVKWMELFNKIKVKLQRK